MRPRLPGPRWPCCDAEQSDRFARVDGITVDPFGTSFTVTLEDYDTISRMITRITSED